MGVGGSGSEREGEFRWRVGGGKDSRRQERERERERGLGQEGTTIYNTFQNVRFLRLSRGASGPKFRGGRESGGQRSLTRTRR